MTATQRKLSACAQAMSRGVSPITTVWARGHEVASPAASPARRRAIGGSIARSSESEPKPPWPRANQCPIPAALSFIRATGSKLPVTSESCTSSRAFSDSSNSGIPSTTIADRSAGQRLAYRRQHSLPDLRRTRVDPLGGNARLEQVHACDFAVGSAGCRPPQSDVFDIHAVYVLQRLTQRGRMLAGRASHEGSVDIEEKQHEAYLKLERRQ